MNTKDFYPAGGYRPEYVINCFDSLSYDDKCVVMRSIMNTEEYNNFIGDKHKNDAYDELYTYDDDDTWND